MNAKIIKTGESLRHFISCILVLILIFPHLAVFAVDESTNTDVTGQTTINQTGCEAKASGDSCVCIGDVAKVTVVITPMSGEEPDPDKEFIISIEGPGSFKENEEKKEKIQKGCPSTVVHDIHVDASAEFGRKTKDRL